MSDEEEEQVGCRICGKNFVSMVALRNHVKMEHFELFSTGNPADWTIPVAENDSDEDDPISCRVCNKVFVRTVALRNHVKMEHFEVYSTEKAANWTDSTPKNPTRKKRSLEKFVISTLDSRPNPEKPFLTKEEEILSSMEPGALTTFADHDVDFIIYKDDLNEPLKKRKKKKKDKVKKDKPPKPPKYTKKKLSKSKNQVGDHDYQQTQVGQANNKTVLRCDKCDSGKTFESQVILNEHMKNCHPSQRAVSCDICLQGFESAAALKLHETEHKGNVHYVCPECPEEFQTYNKLKTHYLIHNAPRPLSCDICKKLFTVKADLDEHYTTIHSISKPHGCELCGSTFTHKHSLKIHMNAMHKASSTFTCKFCSAQFNSTQALQAHENSTHRRQPITNTTTKANMAEVIIIPDTEDDSTTKDSTT